MNIKRAEDLSILNYSCCLWKKQRTTGIRICLPCWMGELRVDPVLPLDPYFSNNSANSFLFRETEKKWKEVSHEHD